MEIIETKYSEIDVLKGWFTDKRSSYLWGGPSLRYPFSAESFLEDINWGRVPTYSAHNEVGELICFGQYYEKLGRCHLARLVVIPSHRSNGVGAQFISMLMNHGMGSLVVNEVSLFVVNYNAKALKCYKSLGFFNAPYPVEQKHYDNIDFMVYQNA